MCLKQIAEGGEELLIVGLEADAGGFVEVGSVDEALEFLQHLGSHTEDWSAEGVFCLLYTSALGVSSCATWIG